MVVSRDEFELEISGYEGAEPSWDTSIFELKRADNTYNMYVKKTQIFTTDKKLSRKSPYFLLSS